MDSDNYEWSLTEDQELSLDSSQSQPTSLRRDQAGKGRDEIKTMLSEMQLKPTPPKKVNPVKKLKVKSNHLRDQVLLIDDLVLVFDNSGVSEFPAAEISKIRRYINLRPGRLTILDEPVVETKLVDQLEKARELVAEFMDEVDLNSTLPMDEEVESSQEAESSQEDKSGDEKEEKEPTTVVESLKGDEEKVVGLPKRPKTRRRLNTRKKKTSN